MSSSTLAELQTRAAAAHGQRPLLETNRCGVTLGDLDARVCAMHRRLGRGDAAPVAILADDPVDWITALFAAARAGRPAVLVDVTLDAPSLARQVGHAGASVIIATPERGRDVLSAATTMRLAARPEVVSVPGDAEVVARGDRAPMDRAPRADAPAVIVYTSGSTGRPKGVVLSHRAVLAAASRVARVARLDASFVGLSIAPFSHAAGLHALLIPLLVGGRLVLPESFKPGAISEVLRRNGVTHLLAPPLFYEAVARRASEAIESGRGLRGAFSRAALRALRSAALRAPGAAGPVGRTVFASLHAQFGPSLRTVFSAGAPLRPEVATTLLALGFDLRDAYGLTETGGVVCLTQRRYGLRPGHIGEALPGVSLRVAANGDADGEIQIRSDQVMLGYHNEPALTELAKAGDWLKTGDVGHRDSGGRLVIRSRERDIILPSNGKNIYPEDVEASFEGVDGVDELCAFPIAQPEGGDRVGLVVVPARNVDVGALRDRLARANVLLPAPRRVQRFFVRQEPLPRTRLAKVKRAQVAAETLSPSPQTEVEAQCPLSA